MKRWKIKDIRISKSNNKEKINKVEKLKKCKLLDFIKTKLLNRKKNEKTQTEYENLKPKKDLDIKSIEALDYAFKEKSVTNIAITGNYSSGKSSLIESYINKKMNFWKKRKINIISLATFLDKKEYITVEDLEKYIIEQLYYSTYNKVLKNNRDKSLLLAIVIYLLITAIILIVRWDILYFYFLQKHFKLIIACLYIVISTLIIYVLKNILKYIYKIDKFALQIMDLNIEIGNDGSNNNVINENMELIIKIFREFGYQIIIFEDLDRFGKPIIFEHLRELNNILNKNIRVKFLYLIKDDVFENENRTKFFDYIYPVVPYISYTTSGEELYKLIEKYNLQNELPKTFIQNITVFVQDMRILKNVLNEFRVYDIELNKKGIKPENLFAMILYKNVFSKDFAMLQNRDGNLYNFFNKKDEKINELKEKIKKNKELIINSNLNLLEEKKIFCRAVERVVMQYMVSRGYSANVKLKNAEQGIKEINTSIKLPFEYLADENTFIMEISKQLTQYLKDNHLELYEMQEKIKEQQEAEVESLREENDEMEEWIAYLEDDATIKEMFENDYIMDEELEVFYSNECNVDNIRRDKLIKYLLQEGYIDEDYNRYIERFHEGTLSKRDNDFYGNCLINKQNDFLEELDNPNIIIQRLDINRFKYKNILNLNILIALLEMLDKAIKRDVAVDEYNNEINIRTTTINAEEKILLQKTSAFIETFISKGDFFENFKAVKQKLRNQEYEKFCVWLSNNVNSFKEILKKFNDKNVKDEALKDLLLNSLIVNIKNSLEFDNLKNYIEENGLFLEYNKRDEISPILDELDIKYKDLSIGYKTNSEIFKYSIKNGNYEINEKNIEIIIRNVLNIENVNIESQMQQNYSIIKNDEKVFEYISSNITLYFSNVYLKNQISRNNPEDIVLLLNNEKLSNEDKLEIINRESKKINENDKTRIGIIQNLYEIQDLDIYNELLECSLIAMTYNNINCFFENMINIEEIEDATEEEKEIREQKIEKEKELLIKFINKYGEKLKEEINNENSSELFLYIGLENRIEDKIFEIIVKSFSRYFTKIGKNDLENISQSKIKILIENKKIEFNDTMYKKIRDLNTESFLLYTIQYKNNIEKNMAKYEFTSLEILTILKSGMHWTFKKKIIYNLENYNNYQFYNINANKIAEYMLDKNWKVNFSITQLKSFISRMNNTEIKLSVINWYFDKLSKIDIQEIINSDLKKYKKLIIDRNRPQYDYNEELEKLINNLITIGYNIECEIDKIKGKIFVKGTIR